MYDEKQTDRNCCPGCGGGLIRNANGLDRCTSCDAICTDLMKFDATEESIDFVFAGLKGWVSPDEVQAGLQRINAKPDPADNPGVQKMREFFQQYRDARDASEELTCQQLAASAQRGKGKEQTGHHVSESARLFRERRTANTQPTSE
jgi:hypothetical protein